MSTWSSGFTANISITNTGTSTINSWTLKFTLPAGQIITSGWNATYAPTSGQVSAANVSYNGTLAGTKRHRGKRRHRRQRSENHEVVI